MENQYYTLMEKQDFFEIIENKYGELAIFIDARDGIPQEPVLEFDGKKTALLKRDERRAVYTVCRLKMLKILNLRAAALVQTSCSKLKARTMCLNHLEL